MADLSNYNTSPLRSRSLFVDFLAVFGIYLYARRYYPDRIRTFIDLLFLFALCAEIAGIFRYSGDRPRFGFIKE